MNGGGKYECVALGVRDGFAEFRVVKAPEGTPFYAGRVLRIPMNPPSPEGPRPRRTKMKAKKKAAKERAGVLKRVNERLRKYPPEGMSPDAQKTVTRVRRALEVTTGAGGSISLTPPASSKPKLAKKVAGSPGSRREMVAYLKQPCPELDNSEGEGTNAHEVDNAIEGLNDVLGRFRQAQADANIPLLRSLFCDAAGWADIGGRALAGYQPKARKGVR